MSSLSGKSTLQCLVNSPNILFSPTTLANVSKQSFFVDALVKKYRSVCLWRIYRRLNHFAKFYRRLNQLATLVEHLVVPKSTGSLQAIQANVRLGRKNLGGTNALAYFEIALVTTCEANVIIIKQS
jgi:hypothetical protein